MGDGGRLGRDFGLVWLGQSVSSVGTAVTSLALPLLAVLTFSASAWQVGLLTAVTYAAYALLSLPLGAWLDRRSRRPLVVLGDLGRLLALGSVPVAQALGCLTYAQLVVVATLVGVLTVVFDVAYQSWLPDLVPPAQLLRANARSGATESAGRLVGPGVAGVLVAAVGAAYTLGLDAASFAVAATTSLAVRAREQPLELPAQPRPLRRDVADGLRWLLRTPVLKWVTACSTTANLFGAMWPAVETLFLVRTLHTGTAVVGAVVAVGSSGGVLGAVLASTAVRRVGTVAALTWSTAAGGVLALVGPLGTPALGAWALAVGTFGFTALNAVYNAAAVSRRQQDAPRTMLARATAANRVFSYGALPLGAVAGGLLAGPLGYRGVLVLAAVGYAAGSLWLLPVLRRGRSGAST